MRICSYCGDRVRIPRDGFEYVHTTSAPRVRNISPGDFVSARHNVKGSPVGSYDVVEIGGVRKYMILTAREVAAEAMGPEPYSLPGRHGTWTLRHV